MGRRKFLTWVTGILGGCAGVLAGIPVLGVLVAPLRRKHKWEPLKLDLAQIPSDGFKQIPHTVKEDAGYLVTKRTFTLWVRRAGDDVIAFSATCTHLNCNVGWNGATREFICPCHDGRFADDGSVKGGPPTKPLFRFETSVEEGTVTVVIPENFAG